MGKKQLNYSDLEGKGLSIESGYIVGGSYSANREKDPLYKIFTVMALGFLNYQEIL